MGTLDLMPHLPQLTGDELDRWIGAALAEAEADPAILGPAEAEDRQQLDQEPARTEV